MSFNAVRWSLQLRVSSGATSCDLVRPRHIQPRYFNCVTKPFAQPLLNIPALGAKLSRVLTAAWVLRDLSSVLQAAGRISHA